MMPLHQPGVLQFLSTQHSALLPSCPRQDLNLDFELRRLAWYPFHHGDCSRSHPRARTFHPTGGRTPSAGVENAYKPTKKAPKSVSGLRGLQSAWDYPLVTRSLHGRSRLAARRWRPAARRRHRRRRPTASSLRGSANWIVRGRTSLQFLSRRKSDCSTVLSSISHRVNRYCYKNPVSPLDSTTGGA